MKPQPTRHRIALLTGLLLGVTFSPPTNAATTLSSGHVEIFEVEYDQAGTNKPTLHLGVHWGTSHYEPADVVLEVGKAALTTTSGLPVSLVNLFGDAAYILPVDLEMAAILGVLEAGVGRSGFPDNGALTFTMTSAGAANPGNFALFTSANAIRLSSTAGTVGAGSFSIVTSHIHYNWGFSAAGTYTFDLQARYSDLVHGILETAVETYTFNVIPEPSGCMLLLAGLGGLAITRRRASGGRS